MTPSIMSCCSGASSSRVFFRTSLERLAPPPPTWADWRAGVGDEIPRREPQFVDAAVDVLGEVADALQPLQLGEGRVDVADRDDAGGRGDDDHRQHQHETAECQLADRKRERIAAACEFGGDSSGHVSLGPGSRCTPNIRKLRALGKHAAGR